MSDVHLAGLCIIFDEGQYKIRKPRGVLSSFDRIVRSGFNVYIEDPDGGLDTLLKPSEAP